MIERVVGGADVFDDAADNRLLPVTRVFVIAALVAAAMYAVAHGDVLAKAKLVGTCTAVAAPVTDGSTRESCREGRLEGWPDLTKRSCVREGFVGDRQMWRCPAPVVASRSAK